MATIRDVAREADVSIATVSRVLNDTGYVSDQLRERVLNAANELHYRPSRAAQSLRSNKTHTIGVLVPQVDQPFFGKLTFAVQTALAAHDYYTLVANTMESREQEAQYLQMMLEQRVEGVLIVPTGQNQEEFEELENNNIPIVIVDRDIDGLPEADRVLCDNEQGAYEGMMHLIELGHRSVCVIGGPRYSAPIQKRIAGIRRAVRDVGDHRLNMTFMTQELPQFDLGYASAMTMLKQDARPTAIFALSDVVAVGVIHAAQERGLRLPDELSIVGFDDIPLASYSIPALTTIRQPIDAIGQRAADMIIERIADDSREARTHQFELTLQIRQSTAHTN